MHKIFLHLGLHKTATTSLQRSIYPHIPDYLYIGRTHPRSDKRYSLYRQITNYCFSIHEHEQQLSSIRKNLEKTLATQSILLSDEWFTSDYSEQFRLNGITWQTKLERLGKIVNDLPASIGVITLRRTVVKFGCSTQQIKTQSVFPLTA